jgi:hypothetical protein
MNINMLNVVFSYQMNRKKTYSNIKHKNNLYLFLNSDSKNCTELYRIFEAEVRYKSHCNINMSTYARYFERALSGVHVIDRVYKKLLYKLYFIFILGNVLEWYLCCCSCL